MTKLMELLLFLGAFFTLWLALIFGLEVSDATRIYIYLIPVFAVAAFGVFSLVILVYRVMTFNDCEEAAAELKKELEEAKKDLTSKGFKFE